MSQNLILSNASQGTVTLASPAIAVTITGTGSNPYYISTSSTATAPTPSDSTNAASGSNSYVLRDAQGIKSIAIRMADTTQTATFTVTINIPC